MICRKNQISSSEWKTERVREDASVDSEDDEEDGDKLPRVIGAATHGEPKEWLISSLLCWE